MIEFRKYLDVDPRYEARDEIKKIITSDYSDHLKLAGVKNQLEEILNSAVSAANLDPDSRKARLQKILAISIIRDFEYGNRRSPFLKGKGYSGLYLENYASTDKLSTKL